MTHTPQELKEKILKYISRDGYRPLKRRQIALFMGVTGTEEDYTQFKLVIGQMVSSGILVKGRGNKYELAIKSKGVVGEINIRGTNYGFVRIRGKNDIVEIRKGNFGSAIHGDVVEVDVISAGKPGRAAQGRVKRVVKAGRRLAVGTVVETRFGMYFIPIRGGVYQEVPVRQIHKKPLAHGELVTVEFVSDNQGGFKANVVERLGSSSEYSTTIQAVLKAFEIPGEFTPQEVKAAQEVLDSPFEIEGREDFRELYTITIDPHDAKDFDDALSLERKEDGGYRVYIHIADVSTAVPRGSELDKLARERGTSVYLPDFVIPMLPYQISTERCCLKELEEKHAKTVVIDYSPKGERQTYRVVRSVVKSNLRLNYEQVYDFLSGDVETLGNGGHADALIKGLWELADMLRGAREDAGSIMLDMPEVKVVLNELGVPIDLKQETGDESHYLIEEFMLAANVAVAELMVKHDIPAIFRVHDEPEPDVMENLRNVLMSFGISVPKEIRKADLGEIIEQVRDKQISRVVNLAILRTMKLAQYSSQLSQHYALSFEKYLHFTSPIRRYPDLFVHQQLEMYYFKSSPVVAEEASVYDLAMETSNLERNSEECERNLVQLKTLEYLARFKGKEADGVITGIKEFGVIVELTQFLVDGLIHVKDMTGEYFEISADATKMVGASGTILAPGKQVKVVIHDVDLPRRRLEIRFQGFVSKDDDGLYNVHGARNRKRNVSKKLRKHSGRFRKGKRR